MGDSRLNILFLTLLSIENIDERGIYTDLIREISITDNIFVVSPRERRMGLDSEVVSPRTQIKLLKVKTGNITKTNVIEKGISTLLIEGQYLRAIKKHFSGIKFDKVIYSTPPITFESILKYYKEAQNCKTFLMLKDIFPQNAVDLGMMKKNSFIWRFFRKKEKRLYRLSDKIGCMSQGNVDYLLKHNPEIPKGKVIVFPNAILPLEKKEKKGKNQALLEKYNIPVESILFVYGGNLGRPQGIDFILKVIENFISIKNAFLVIVGNGTEYRVIQNFIKKVKPNNVKLIEHLPKKDYDYLLETSDVGLIFLDKRFTIPNFPSRLTAYMESRLPILAATDKSTDLKEILYKSNSGLWSESGDLDSFFKNVKLLVGNESLCKTLGNNGRKFLEENYNVEDVAKIITEK